MANKSKAAFVGVLSKRDSILPKPNMKRSQLTTTLLQQEEDVLVSKNSAQKGLQQYFTPLKIGTWIRHILDQKTGLVVDLTAGAGNLLMPWVSNQNVGDKSLGNETMQALGVELDKENIPKSTTFLNVVNANVAELYPLLLQVEFHADVFVLNPPFTLFWHIPELTNSEHKTIESQLATVKMAISMTKHRGQGAFLVAKSAWDKSISQDEEITQYVHSAVIAKNLFLPYANVDCVICFYVKTGKRGHSSQYKDIEFDLESPTVDRDLVAAARKVKSERQYYSMYPELWSSEEVMQDHRDRFLAAAAEYKVLKRKKQQAYNIEYKGGRIKVYLSNFQRFTFLKDFTYEENALVEKMHGLSPSYFAFNTQDRRALFTLVDERKLLTMDEAARKAITDAVSNAEFILTPMYELKPQQRLGYLEEIDKIRCIKSGIRRFEERTVAFRKGEEYDVKVTSATIESWYEKETGASGVSKDMVKLAKALNIDVGGAAFGESGDDITFLIDHFEIPDPRDVRDKKPKLYDRIRRRLESDEFKQFTFRGFQVEDLTRLSMKPSAVLSWEQGLGKTRGALAWLKVRYVKKALIICPQDLKKQWTSEARDLGVQLFEIQGYRDLQNIEKEKSGIWLIHYELLKGTRRRDRLVEGFGKAVVIKLDHRDEDVVKNFNALCPNCKALRQDGWNGYSCKKCQYHVWTQRVKPMYSYLKHAFDGIVIDEGVKIKSKHSQQGIAGRSLHAKNRLLLSGSPIKGWITDAFWLLHWTLGNATPRFPYHYVGGTEKFLDDFGVWEYVGEEFKKSLSKGKKKLLPEIGNLHLLWKLFAPSIIRRVKADTGETMVAKNVHRIKVQFTKSQKETYDWWIGNFTEWYEASHITEMDDNAIAMREMILGLLWKLRITATVPASRLLPGVPMTGKEDTFFEGKQGDSNYTEKALFVLQKLKEITEKGEQAVVFSSLQDNQRFLFQLCTRFGIKAVVANAETPPEKRGYIMADFKHRKFLVLIAGTQAVNLGHNLDNANHVFMTDYEWDHSTTRQAIDRVHRFTSKKDVNVYLLYTEGGIDYRQLFEIIDRKGQSSDLALDGKLLDEAEEQIDFFKIAREIMRDHKRGTEGLLEESEIEDKMISIFVKNRAVVIGEEHAHAVERSVPRITLRVVEIKDQLEMHF